MFSGRGLIGEGWGLEVIGDGEGWRLRINDAEFVLVDQG
jgi:hypothetical protein